MEHYSSLRWSSPGWRRHRRRRASAARRLHHPAEAEERAQSNECEKCGERSRIKLTLAVEHADVLIDIHVTSGRAAHALSPERRGERERMTYLVTSHRRSRDRKKEFSLVEKESLRRKSSLRAPRSSQCI